MQAKVAILLLIVTSTLTQPLPEQCVQEQCMESVVGKVAGNVPLNVAYGHGGAVADGAELSKAQASSSWQWACQAGHSLSMSFLCIL